MTNQIFLFLLLYLPGVACLGLDIIIMAYEFHGKKKILYKTFCFFQWSYLLYIVSY